MKYHPITDTFKLLPQQRALLDSPEFAHVYPSLDDYLNKMARDGIAARKDLALLLHFLVSVVGNSKGTQMRFRNEAERFVLFCWNEKHKSILELDTEDIRDYIDWIWSPPKALISDTTIASRFKAKAGSDIRTVNKTWRPFVLRQSKANRKTNEFISPERSSLDKPKSRYSLNQTSLQNSYASLNVFLKELWGSVLGDN